MMIAVRLLTVALASLGVTHACECSEPTVQDAKKRASVIFRGTITALRPTNKRSYFGIDTGKVAVFHVARVWKGHVGSVFEMPAVTQDGGCWGFSESFLKIASDILVYAVREEGAYYTSTCTRTQFANFAAKDLEELGPGKPAKPSPVRSISK